MHLLHIRTSRSCIPVEISCPRSYSFPGMHISTAGIDLLRTNGAADFLVPKELHLSQYLANTVPKFHPGSIGREDNFLVSGLGRNTKFSCESSTVGRWFQFWDLRVPEDS